MNACFAHSSKMLGFRWKNFRKIGYEKLHFLLHDLKYKKH